VMIWQDPFNNNVTLAPQTVVEVWRGSDYTTLMEVLKAGFPAVMAGFWYLDHLEDTWDTFYVQEIDNGQIPSDLLELVIGGEACMWGEWVDANNWESRVFPRATAVAEVLWSSEAYPRIPIWNSRRFHAWRCRMNRRGFNVESVSTMYGDGYCNPL